MWLERLVYVSITASSQKNARLGDRGFQPLVTLSKVTTSLVRVCFAFEPTCWLFSTGSCELSKDSKDPKAAMLLAPAPSLALALLLRKPHEEAAQGIGPQLAATGMFVGLRWGGQLLLLAAA